MYRERDVYNIYIYIYVYTSLSLSIYIVIYLFIYLFIEAGRRLGRRRRAAHGGGD